MYDPDTVCIAFADDRLIARGPIAEVARATKQRFDTGDVANILVFDAVTSRPVEIDLRGSEEQVVARVAGPVPEVPRGRGRPKLGVVGKEVTLLPRHWEWLESQPGGASVTLRKLVEAARKDAAHSVREVRDSTYRFMLAMAGDEPGFEEATRALYAGRRDEFEALVEAWPDDVRDHVRSLADSAFED